jgi:methyl-accepting chemotaxis protein
MKSFKDFSIVGKLGIGFGFLIAMLCMVGAFSIWQLSKVNAASHEITENWLPAVQGLLQMKYDCSTLRRNETQHILSSDEKGMKMYEDSMQSALRQIMDDQQRYEPTITGISERERYSAFLDRWSAFLKLHGHILELSRGRKKEEARTLSIGDARSAFNAAMTALDKVVEFNYLGAAASTTNIEQTYRHSKAWILGLLVVAMIVGVIQTVFTTRQIAGPLRKTVDVLAAVAERDLTKTAEADSEDELGVLARSLNKTMEVLQATITVLSQNAEHVASASEELSSSATQQAKGAESQRDRITQIATAMQEMASTVMQVSENSNQAAAAARQAAETARASGSIVEGMLSTMREIAESVQDSAGKVEELGKSSDQIGRIIGVIDDIADQTNLLALNAAIEAARAGEQGRGFAVVADEVRKLAERTTTATKEIAQMIQGIQNETRTAVAAMESGTEKVHEGVNSTSKAGDSLKEIIRTSEQVGEMIMHIATAATQQSSATDQVNASMEEIRNLVKESAMGATQSAKACQELSELAFDLEKTASSFKLSGQLKAADSLSARHQVKVRGAAAS